MRDLKGRHQARRGQLKVQGGFELKGPGYGQAPVVLGRGASGLWAEPGRLNAPPGHSQPSVLINATKLNRPARKSAGITSSVTIE